METMTIRDVAKVFQISTRTVYRLIARGELPGLRVGKQWRVPRDVVMRMIGGPKPQDLSSPWERREVN